MTAHYQPAEAIVEQLKTDPAHGLTGAEVTRRLEEYGPNQLQSKKKKSLIARFVDQLKDPMIIILFIAAIISFVIALNGHDYMEFFEPALILLIVIANAIMGVSQESKAEAALDALKEMTTPHARVLRDGAETLIDAKDLVPGDIISVEAGDFIPADGRLLESASLKSEESALTGESVPSEKDAKSQVEEKSPLGDRHNMIYTGCSVAYGRGIAVVTGTGMDTEMGKIAGMLSETEETVTPLQQRMGQLSKVLGIMAIGICAIIFVLGLVFDMAPMEIFMTAVSLAVAAIPEGLPAIVTIVLAIGVQRMVTQNAIIRSLPAVETLGSASVICSDKTGTLTLNQMTVVRAYEETSNQDEAVGGVDNSEGIDKLLQYATLCTDGSIVFEDGKPVHIGDPTETSIIFAAYENGMIKEDLLKQYPRLEELPFDSERKLMSVICDMDGQKVVITKGAYDSVAPRCISGDVEKASDKNDAMSREALRVLAVAYKVIDEIPATVDSETIENGLTFMGLVGIIDPPRPEVRDAVEVCREAGIHPVMITGDHVVTASAIATDLGIMREGDRAVTGTDLLDMTDEQLDNEVEHISVYARVSPEDKIRIVKAWQDKGQVVAMTGDGVNDAPALKAADIGCAMGITGTDVAKGAADMTLTDDNFTTIVHAVKEGRGIYDNIRKVVGFLLSSNIGEVFTVLIAMLIWRTTPLVSLQLLWINLVTDGLPAIALGREPVEDNIMLRQPRPKEEGIFAHGMGIQIFLQGLLFAGLTLVAFALGYYWQGTPNIDVGRTMAFIVLALVQIVHSFNMRTQQSLFSIKPFSNSYLNRAAVISVLLIAALVFIEPVAEIFSLTIMPLPLYFIALGMCLVPLPVVEAAKAIRNGKDKIKAKQGKTH